MHYQRLSLSIFLTSLVEIFNKIYPLVIVKLVIERIGYQAFGFAQFGITLVELSVPLITFGYHSYASLAVGRHETSSAKIVEVFSNILVLKAIHAVCLGTGIAIALSIVPHFAQYKWLIVVLSFTIAGNVLDSSWMNIGLQKISMMATIIIFSKILSLLGILFLVSDQNDAILYAALHCAANTVVNLATFYTFVKKYPLRIRASMGLIKDAFNQALPYAFVAIIHILFLRLDWLVVQQIFGDLGTGFYAGPVRINNAIYSFLAAVGTVFFSESIRCRDKEERQAHYRIALFFMSFLVVPFLFVAWNFDQEILAMILGQIDPSQERVFSILALGSIGSVGINLFGMQILGTMGQIKKMVIALALGLFVSILILVYLSSDSSTISLAKIALAMVIGKTLSTFILAAYSKKFLQRILYPSTTRIVLSGLVVVFLREIGVLQLTSLHFVAQIVILCLVYVLFAVCSNYRELMMLMGELSHRKTKV